MILLNLTIISALLFILLAKEFIIINQEFFVILAFIIVFMAMKRSLGAAVAESLQDRKDQILAEIEASERAQIERLNQAKQAYALTYTTFMDIMSVKIAMVDNLVTIMENARTVDSLFRIRNKALETNLILFKQATADNDFIGAILDRLNIEQKVKANARFRWAKLSAKKVASPSKPRKTKVFKQDSKPILMVSKISKVKKVESTPTIAKATTKSRVAKKKNTNTDQVTNQNTKSKKK
jgi:hypothetical protein